MHRSLIRNTLSLAVVAAAVGVAVMGAANSAQAAGSWEWYDTNGNGRADTAAIDRNGDGRLDEAWYDSNENGRWDVVTYNRNGDNLFEEGWVDVGENGTWSVSAYDTNRDGTYEWLRGRDPSTGAVGWVYSAPTYTMTFIDRDANGRYENQYYDGNRDGVAEYVMSDTTGDGAADTWRAVVTSTPSVNSARASNDAMVKHIVTMNQLRIYGTRIWG